LQGAARDLGYGLRVLVVLGDEVSNLRIDDFAISPPAEDSKVASALDREMTTSRRGDLRA
jgi:hypothetical protein